MTMVFNNKSVHKKNPDFVKSLKNYLIFLTPFPPMKLSDSTQHMVYNETIGDANNDIAYKIVSYYLYDKSFP